MKSAGVAQCLERRTSRPEDVGEDPTPRSSLELLWQLSPMRRMTVNRFAAIVFAFVAASALAIIAAAAYAVYLGGKGWIWL